MEEPVRIAIALSGGTAKSVAHIGVLMALEEAEIGIERIAATSGGAIVAAHYAAGIPLEEMAKFASRMKLTDLGRIGFGRLGLLSSEKLYRMVADQIGERTFDELRIPLLITVTNLMTGEREILDSGVVARAAQASACIPQIYAPVEMNGALYVDGGIVEYMPCRALATYDPELIVGVNLGYYRDVQRPRHILSLAMRTIGVIGQHNARVSEQYAGVVIRPNLSRFSSFEIKEAEAMIQVGYEETLAAVPAIREAWAKSRSLRTRIGRFIKKAVSAEPANGEVATSVDPVEG